MNYKNLIPWFIIVLVFIGLVFFVNMKDEADGHKIVSYNLDTNDFNISIYLGVTRLSYDHFQITPSDSVKMKAIFKENQLLDEFSLEELPTNYIKFKMGDPNAELEHFVLVVDPVAMRILCYNFLQPDIAYGTTIDEDDVIFLETLQDKYSQQSKQVGDKLGNVSIFERTNQNDEIVFKFDISYPDSIITELYIKVLRQDGSISGNLYPLNQISNGFFEFGVLDSDSSLKEIQVIIRGYEMKDNQENPFQNIFFFNDLDK